MCALSAGLMLLHSYIVLSDTPWRKAGSDLPVRCPEAGPEGRVGGKKCKSTQHVKRFSTGAGFFLALSPISLTSEAQYPITPVLACVTGRDSIVIVNQISSGPGTWSEIAPGSGEHSREPPRRSNPQRHGRRRRRRMEEGFAWGRPEARERSLGRTGARPEQGWGRGPQGLTGEGSPPSSGAAAG